jgi:DeoR/GlpR family transcriptional regulator of sugar metabolism
MTRRPTITRREQILQRLAEHGRVQVDELSHQLNTSEVTIRKDLSALEASGKLVRRYGGAVPSFAAETRNDGIDSEVSNRKLAIGQAASRLISDDRILIDFGSTTTTLISHLSRYRQLVVMTNSMRTANAVLALTPAPTLLMTGGTWDAQTHSFQGQIAEQVLRSYDFDQLFIGCDGIDLERGTSTFNELLGLSQVMAESAKQIIVMAEADKVGRRIPNLEIPWRQIDVLVTDKRLSANAKTHIEQHGVEVIIADTTVSQNKTGDE